MTALKPINLLPDLKYKRSMSASFFDGVNTVKSSYNHLNKFLRLGEALTSTTSALLFQPSQQIIKEQIGLLTAPSFIASARRYYDKLSALSTVGKVEAFKSGVIPTLQFVQSGANLLQYMHTIRLVNISKALKPLVAINAITRLIVCGHSFALQIKRQLRSFTPTRNEGFLFFRNLLNFYSAAFFIITFFLNLCASPYWMLAGSSFLLIATLVDNLLKFVLD